MTLAPSSVLVLALAAVYALAAHAALRVPWPERFAQAGRAAVIAVAVYALAGACVALLRGTLFVDWAPDPAVAEEAHSYFTDLLRTLERKVERVSADTWTRIHASIGSHKL